MPTNSRSSKIWPFLLGAAVGGGIALALNSRQGREMLDRFKVYMENSGELFQGLGERMQESFSKTATAASEKAPGKEG